MVNSLDDCGIVRERENVFCLKSDILCLVSACLSVSQQLINHIDQFLENKGSQYYMKAINCIRVFREETMKVTVICEN